LAITDTKFISTSRRCIKPQFFSSKVTEDVIQLCYNYFDQFQEAPSDHFQDEIVRFLKDREVDEKKLYTKYLNKVVDMDIPSRDYVLSRINNFIKAREFSTSAIEFVKLTEKGNFEEARQLMMHALRSGVESFETGIRYLDNDLPTYYNSDKGQELMNLGIESMGDLVMLKRRQVVCILGGGKGKKSWFCIHLAGHAISNGLKVLYISHEMTETEVEMRFDMMFGGLVSREAYKNVKFLEIDSEGEVVSESKKVIDTVYKSRKVKRARRAVKKLGGDLIIKKYPMGSCTMGELDRYLDHLEVFESYVPDVIINDYPDIMKLPGGPSEERNAINRCYIDHKRIADERNILMIIPSQTNREALEKAYLSKKDFAADIRKLANVDLVVALAQSRDLARENRMRITALAARSDEDNISCMVSQNIRIGQAVVDSWREKRKEDDEE
jgi:hypothetical protein